MSVADGPARMTCPAAATCWPGSRGARGRRAGRRVRSGLDGALLNVSENATYLVGTRTRGRRSCGCTGSGTTRRRDRVRAGLDGRAARRGRGAHPAGLPAPGGRRVTTMPTRPGSSGLRRRVPGGREPADNTRRTSPSWARSRPGCIARAAVAAAGLVHPVPLGLRRRVRRRARWGRWQDGTGVGQEHDVLGRLDVTLRDRLAGFGTGPQRYGLVHADTRLANLIVRRARGT